MIHIPLLKPISGSNLKTGLISCWEPTAAFTIYDRVGTNNGSISNCSYSNGELTFNGYSSMVTFTNNISGFSNGITIAGWFKPTDVTTKHLFVLLKRSSGAVDNYQFYWNKDTHKIYMHIGPYVVLETSVQFDPNSNTYYHIAITYDKSNAKFYLNGSQFGNTVPSSTDIPESSYYTYFGYGGDSTNYCSTVVKQVALWNKALAATEITALYNSGSVLLYSNW